MPDENPNLTQRIQQGAERSRLTGRQPEGQPYVPKPQFFIFFSFDLVNSTGYKSQNENTWLGIFEYFYKLIHDNMVNHNDERSARLWKFAGDEVLLYREIKTIEEVAAAIRDTYRVLHLSIEALKDYSKENNNKGLLSVKACVWCAEAIQQEREGTNSSESSPVVRNRVIIPPMSNNNAKDFLGPDIDAGFRVSKWAARERLVVSADLAYLILLQHEYQSDHSFWLRYGDREFGAEVKRMRIVWYEKLDGIWGNRHYPIIWYENQWKAIKNTFLYDERLRTDRPVNKVIAKIHNDAKSSLIEIAELKRVYENYVERKFVEDSWEHLRRGEYVRDEEFLSPVLNNTEDKKKI
jgi:hypothetical protein